MAPPLSYAGLEMGGTKTMLGFGSSPSDLSDLIRIPTTSPSETLETITAAIRSWGGDALGGIGVASFGPIGLDRDRADWGCVLDTPKPGWSGVEIGPELQRRLGLPVAIVTDVMGAALAEGRWGACRGLDSHAYVTVGTGIGAGLIQRGVPLLGATHPEVGHISVARDPSRDLFEGGCPFHGDCLEGLASGPAVAARCGAPAETLAPDAPVWSLIGDYLGQLAVTLDLTVAPQRIVFGGGIGGLEHLLPRIRSATHRRLNGYLSHLRTLESMAAHIVAPALGVRSGVLGALLIAAEDTPFSAQEARP